MKKLIFGLFFLGLPVIGNATFSKTALTGVDCVSYSNNIQTAVNVIGSSVTTLIVSSTCTLNQNTTVPSNITLKVVRGGYITSTDSYVFTVNGEFEAGRYQIFTNYLSTNIIFSDLEFSFPEWFGGQTGGTVDNLSALKAVISLGVPTAFGKGTYLVSSTATVNTNVLITGQGIGKTFLKRSGSDAIFLVTSSATIADMTLDGNSGANAVLIASGSFYSNFRRIEMKNVGGVDGSSYAMKFWNATNQFINCEGLEFNNNVGDMWMENLTYARFYGTKFYDITGTYHLDFSTTNTNHQVTDVMFRDTFVQNGSFLKAVGVSGIRDLTFDGVRGRTRNKFTAPWWYIYFYGAGGEAAQITLNNCSIQQDINTTAVPIFYDNCYQHTFNNLHIVNLNADTGWPIFKDGGTNNLVIKHFEVESTNPYVFFSTDSTGGFNTRLEDVNWTQGVTGDLILSNAKPNASYSAYQTVDGTNMNVSIRQSLGSGLSQGYAIRHVNGFVDLTNAGGPVDIFDITGGTRPSTGLSKIIDPNLWSIGASTICISTSNTIGASNVYQDACRVDLGFGNWSISAHGDFSINNSSWSQVTIGISTVAVPGSQITPVLASGRNRANISWTGGLSGLMVPQVSDPSIGSYVVSYSTSDSVVLIPHYLKILSVFTTGNPTFLGSLRATRLRSQ